MIKFLSLQEAQRYADGPTLAIRTCRPKVIRAANGAVYVAEQIEVLEAVLEKMTECAQLLRQLRDPRIEAYCLAAFEGREGGWLGEFERDILEQKLRALKEGDDEDEEAEEE